MVRPPESWRSVECVYADEAVTERYEPDAGLFGAETLLFERSVTPGADVLDLGVGAGRTTAWLAPRSGRYVGLDIAPTMVERCRHHFPDSDIRLGDASDLAAFDDASFDLVVFSFNGIDHLPSDDVRGACLAQCHRVLRPHGRLILSRHNPRMLVEPVQLRSSGRWRRTAWKSTVRRLLDGVVGTCRRIPQRLTERSFWRGHGYTLDAHHGGMRLHAATPRAAAVELRLHGFDVLAGPLAASHPQRFRLLLTPWYYLEAERIDVQR